MKKLIAVTAMLVLFAACGGTKPPVNTAANQPVDCTPAWYLNPPSDDQYIYAAQRATSPDMQMAFNIAEQNARRSIATQIQNETKTQTDAFAQQIGATDDPTVMQTLTQVSSSIAAELLNDVKVDTRVQCRENNSVIGYVLMKMPKGELKLKLLEQMKQQKELLAKYETEKAIAKMEADVDRYKKEYK